MNSQSNRTPRASETERRDKHQRTLQDDRCSTSEFEIDDDESVASQLHQTPRTNNFSPRIHDFSPPALRRPNPVWPGSPRQDNVNVATTSSTAPEAHPNYDRLERADMLLMMEESMPGGLGEMSIDDPNNPIYSRIVDGFSDRSSEFATPHLTSPPPFIQPVTRANRHHASQSDRQSVISNSDSSIFSMPHAASQSTAGMGMSSLPNASTRKVRTLTSPRAQNRNVPNSSSRNRPLAVEHDGMEDDDRPVVRRRQEEVAAIMPRMPPVLPPQQINADLELLRDRADFWKIEDFRRPAAFVQLSISKAIEAYNRGARMPDRGLGNANAFDNNRALDANSVTPEILSMIQVKEAGYVGSAFQRLCRSLPPNDPRLQEAANDHARVRGRLDGCLDFVNKYYKYAHAEVSDFAQLKHYQSAQIGVGDDAGGAANGDGVNYNDETKLLLAVLERLSKDGYARGPDPLWLYSQVVICGHNTHFWKRTMLMRDYLDETIARFGESTEPLWAIYNMYTHSKESLEKRIRNTTRFELTRIETDKNLYSFRNGLFDIKDVRFYAYASAHYIKLDFALAAHNYFDYPLDTRAFDPVNGKLLRRADGSFEFDYAAPGALPIPSADSIFDTQEYNQSIRDSFFMAHGRAFYWLGTHDPMQFGIFYLGASGSGKSTLGRLFVQVFPANRRGHHSAVGEQVFGFEKFIDEHDQPRKDVLVVWEVTDQMNMTKDKVLSIASNDPVEVASKNQLARTADPWGIPSLWVGNVYFPYDLSDGAIPRRFLLFPLMILPTVQCDWSTEQMNAQMPNYILRCVLTYRDFCWNTLKFRDPMRANEPAYANAPKPSIDIWQHVDHELLDFRSTTCAERNTTLAMFRSGCWIVPDETKSLSMNDIAVAHRAYCTSENARSASFRLSKDSAVYRQCAAWNPASCKTGDYMDYEGAACSGRHLAGFTIAETQYDAWCAAKRVPEPHVNNGSDRNGNSGRSFGRF